MPKPPLTARLRLLFTAALLAATLAADPACAQEPNALARAVEATFLYKFVPFVEWPKTAFPSATSPVYVCVLGNNQFGALVARAAAGQHVGTHPITVRILNVAAPESACHVMYVGPQGADPVATTLAHARGWPMLTVTDEENGDSKGVVHFVIRDGRVRFEIDNRLAREEGLTINPKLLELAVKVVR